MCNGASIMFNPYGLMKQERIGAGDLPRVYGPVDLLSAYGPVGPLGVRRPVDPIGGSECRGVDSEDGT